MTFCPFLNYIASTFLLFQALGQAMWVGNWKEMKSHSRSIDALLLGFSSEFIILLLI